jgi:hypothetical protein|tara:strand:- start:5092 stop:6483 length:1392 start_codon:yes stop_codon:yes gene_type:complete
MAITKGTMNAIPVASESLGSFNNQVTAADYGSRPDQRRIYNFGDRIAELAPEESPFFVYLSQTAKLPTDDSLFRYLEDRTKIDFTSREFLIDGTAVSNATVNSTHSLTVDTRDGAAVNFLVKGMVIAIQTDYDANGYANIIVRVEDDPVVNAADTSFTAKVISISTAASGSDEDDIADGDVCQIIGSAYAEGSGSPDVFSDSFDDNYGYTQIFKTAAEITNTALAINMRGVANEFERVLAQKMREHKIDIERAMLFNHKARDNAGIQYTEGLVGHILKNSTFVDGASSLSYNAQQAYAKTYQQSELTYDALLGDFEVLFDPARGGSDERLALCSLPVITFFNKMGDGAFLDKSTESTQYRLNMNEANGAFGHQLMEVNTIHGSVYMVKEPLFRGHSKSLMLMADMSKLYYRPLVGNGVNRDTVVMDNVQGADEDLRKDMILTEAGLEVCLPESHYLINLEGIS